MNWVAMFPGQGSQKAGMGEELLELYPNLLIILEYSNAIFPVPKKAIDFIIFIIFYIVYIFKVVIKSIF